ncbi:MAG TPA: MBL fold metallo-hydrolase [Vicinamibacterales bacterium]|jgi:glyoxylase-like metal-dependent hydrolase (beta-lactamase superfamily II)
MRTQGMRPPLRLADDVWVVRTVFVNVFFVRTDSATRWFLVDAGVRGSAETIRQTARALFGSDARPFALVLTHGHFDHVGSLRRLVDEWNVPVYAHWREVPHLTGSAPYPPPDPTVGGGLFAWSSWLFPSSSIDVADHLLPLPEDGAIPGATGWRAIPTPGHTNGHIALYRERDGTLIAGDAVTTTRPESATAVARQRAEVHGPPAYFTSDWGAAHRSVQTLAALNAETLASGHGPVLYGETMREELRRLADGFVERAVPSRGRYVRQPARIEPDGSLILPPDPFRPAMRTVLGAAAAAVVAAGIVRRIRASR